MKLINAEYFKVDEQQSRQLLITQSLVSHTLWNIKLALFYS